MGGDTGGSVTFCDIRNIILEEPFSAPPILYQFDLAPRIISDVVFDGTKCCVTSSLSASSNVVTSATMTKIYDIENGLGSGLVKEYDWVIQGIDTYKLNLHDSELIMGTRKGDIVRFNFEKGDGFINSAYGSISGLVGKLFDFVKF